MTRSLRSGTIVGLSLALLLSAAACSPGQAEVVPPQIRYSEDVCAQCNMIISDARFAAGYVHEISPGRFESLPFDDIGDMLEHAGMHPEHQIVAWYVHDYASQSWLDATQAYYVLSRDIGSPMGHGLAAHGALAAAEGMADQLGGEVVDWTGLRTGR